MTSITSIYGLEKVPSLVAIHSAYNESEFCGLLEDKILEDYIKQSLFPLVVPINEETLKSMEDDARKIVLIILNDEEDEKSRELLKVLKAAASENHDLIFGYVGFKQWEGFGESLISRRKLSFRRWCYGMARKNIIWCFYALEIQWPQQDLCCKMSLTYRQRKVITALLYNRSLHLFSPSPKMHEEECV